MRKLLSIGIVLTFFYVASAMASCPTGYRNNYKGECVPADSESSASTEKGGNAQTSSTSNNVGIATVVVEGLGEDIDSAVQQAAEAALTQVVGSFIDSNKLIEKRKEIRDGIKTQTKTITSELSEYSQGSIAGIEVLNVERDGGLTRATVEVTVRLGGFKHYILETVLAEGEIKEGLLGQLKVNENLKSNLTDLLINKVLQPLFSTQVVIPEIATSIEEVTVPEIVQMFQPAQGEYVIFFGVQVKLNPDYLTNMQNVLEQTAERKFGVRNFPPLLRWDGNDVMDQNFSAVIAIGTPFGPNPQRAPGLQTSSFGLLDFSNQGSLGEYFSEMPVFYAYPATNVNLCTELKAAIGLDHRPGTFMPNRGFVYPALKMQFVSADGSVLRNEVIDGDPYKYGSNYSTIFAETSMTAESNGRYPDGTTLVSLLRMDPEEYNVRNCGIFISKSTYFVVVTKVSQSVLAKAEKIVLSYTW